jgi:branched-subunit amino acid transport protein
MLDQQNLWVLVIASILATYLWRFLGALFAKRIDPQGMLFGWVTCVSYAMLAGLISRMIFVPAGSLAEVDLWIRLAGITTGLMVFYVCRRQVLLGVGAGLAVFIALVSGT